MSDAPLRHKPEAPGPVELCRITPRSRHRITPWESAFHEAGHVVAHMAVGGAPRAAWLSSGCRLAGRPVVSLEYAFSRTRPHLGWRCAVILAAGERAEEMARGQGGDPDDWVLNVLETMDYPESTDISKLAPLIPKETTYTGTEEWLAAVYACAGRILEDRWGDVRLVAAELHARRRLGREDLAALGLAERTHVDVTQPA